MTNSGIKTKLNFLLLHKNISAQNDANFRKEKIQSFKLRGEKQAGNGIKRSVDQHPRSNTPIQTSSNHQLLEQTTRIDRLHKEIDALKETNRNLAEQVQVNI